MIDFANDDLRREAVDLQSEAADGVFNPETWEDLIKRFEQAGRTSGASNLRARMMYYQGVFVEMQV